MSCWLMVKVGARERGHEIDEDVTFIGSAEDAQVRVQGDGIDERHCQVLRTGDSYRLIDLGSGISVNGAAVSQHELQDGDVVQVGVVSLTFRARAAAAGGAAQAAPAPAPAAAPAPRAAAPRAGASRSGGRRSSSRARGGRQEREEQPAGRQVGSTAQTRRNAKVAAVRARKERGDDGNRPLQRRRVRDSRGIPEPALIAMIVSAVVVGGFLLYKLVTHETVDVDGMIAKANTAWQNEQYQEAENYITAAKNAIDESHSQWDYVLEKYNEFSQMRTLNLNARNVQNEMRVFANNLQPFYKKYIDIAPGNKQFAQYRNDPTTARYFVEFRLKPYLDKYGDSANAGQVRAWVASLETRYNKADPFPNPAKWWDTEVLSSMESRLEHHGFAYKVLSEYKKANPNEKVEIVNDKLGLERERGEKYLAYIMDRLDTARDNKIYDAAVGWAMKGVENLRGMDDLARQAYEKGQEVARIAKQNGTDVDMSKFPSF